MSALTLLLICVVLMHAWIYMRSSQSGRTRAFVLAVGLVVIGMLTGFMGILAGLGAKSPTLGQILLAAPFIFVVLSFLPYTSRFRGRNRK